MKSIKILTVNLAILAIGLSCAFLVFTGFNYTDVNSLIPTKHVVIIYKMKFIPENIEVKKGDIIEWINNDIVPHDVTEINKKWTSKAMNQGDKFSKVISEDFIYFCSIHVVMKGSVTMEND